MFQRISIIVVLVLFGLVGAFSIAVANGDRADSPAGLLTDGQMVQFSNLSSSVQAMLADEFIPFLVENGFDEISRREFFAQVVAAEHATALRLAGDLPVSAMDLEDGGTCLLTGPEPYHNSTSVLTYGSVSCTVM